MDKGLSRIVRRSPFLLLEVMIAFLLMALCLVPLLEPHYAMLQSDVVIVEESKMERVVQKLYAHFLISLYQEEVSWADVDHYNTAARSHSVDQALLEGLPFNATYIVRIAPYTKRKKGEYSRGAPRNAPKDQHPYHLLEIIYTFSPQVAGARETREFSFRPFIKKRPPNTSTP